MHRLCIVCVMNLCFFPFSCTAGIPQNPADIQQEMWVSQTPMNWNCYFLIKRWQQSSRRRVCIEYVLCRALKVSPLPSNIIQPPLSGGVEGGLPRPQLYTHSAYTKHKGGWLACKIIVIQTLSLPSFLFFPTQ